MVSKASQRTFDVFIKMYEQLQELNLDPKKVELQGIEAKGVFHQRYCHYVNWETRNRAASQVVNLETLSETSFHSYCYEDLKLTVFHGNGLEGVHNFKVRPFRHWVGRLTVLKNQLQKGSINGWKTLEEINRECDRLLSECGYNYPLSNSIFGSGQEIKSFVSSLTLEAKEKLFSDIASQAAVAVHEETFNSVPSRNVLGGQRKVIIDAIKASQEKMQSSNVLYALSAEGDMEAMAFDNFVGFLFSLYSVTSQVAVNMPESVVSYILTQAEKRNVTHLRKLKQGKVLLEEHKEMIIGLEKSYNDSYLLAQAALNL